jgi:hypothetical protein
MRIIEKTVYQFHELDDRAKSRAREWWRQCDNPAWADESLDSIKTFVEHFGARLTDWRVDAYCPVEWTTDAEQRNFRGLKLRDFKRDHMPTGYCLDCDLWMTFYDEFKRTGDAKHAYEQAIAAGFRAWRKDMEWQDSDEYIDETIEANEYEFYEDGSIA